MHNILNKLILFFGIMLILLISYPTEKIIIPMLSTIAVASLSEFFHKDRLALIFFIGFIGLCVFYPVFLLTLPIVFYDVIISRYEFAGFLIVVPWIMNLGNYNFGINLALLVLLAISVIVKYKAVQYNKLHIKYIKSRDELTEMSMNLEKKVEDLMMREDFLVSIATLNERNRIAHEIHDNVGHLLTSSIIQIGAIMAITKEETTKEMLGNIKSTLDVGMNSIRNSIHNIHEDSIDLYLQISNIINTFTFCETTLNYEITNDLNINIKYAVIGIVKEALANVMKHSNATKVSISLYEHPSLYQIIIIDNGTLKSKSVDNGMGLQGIKNRVNSLGGIVNFDESKGFKIFISLMKEKVGEKNENSSN